MRSFRRHLNEKLNDKRFRRLYEEERQLTELSLKIHQMRAQLGLSQQEVATSRNSNCQRLRMGLIVI